MYLFQHKRIKASRRDSVVRPLPRSPPSSEKKSLCHWKWQVVLLAWEQSIKGSLNFEALNVFKLLQNLLQNLSLRLNANLPLQNAHLLIRSTGSGGTAPERSSVGQQLFYAAWEHRNLQAWPFGGHFHCPLDVCCWRRSIWRRIQAWNGQDRAMFLFDSFSDCFNPCKNARNAATSKKLMN